MVSPTKDPSICPLKRLITSSPRSSATTNSAATGRTELLIPTSISSENVRKFCLLYYSGTKVDSELLQTVVSSSEFSVVCDDVLINPIFDKFPIRKSYRRSLLKEISKIMGADTPDSVYDALAECVVDQDEFSYRIYTDASGFLLCALREHNQQLSFGTTGLSVWQASCDLAHVISSSVDLENRHVLELGAGCGLAGIAATASNPSCSLHLTDYDPKVLAQLNQNVADNFQKSSRIRVSSLDWSSFDISQVEILPDVVIASDVVYDRALLPSLCNVIRSLLQSKDGCIAIVASTLRDPDTLMAFRKEIQANGLLVSGETSYFHNIFEFRDGSRLRCETRFPFYSTLETPTIFFYLCLQ